MINIEIKTRTSEPEGKTVISENVYINAPLTAEECMRCKHELEMCLGIVVQLSGASVPKNRRREICTA